MSFLGSAAGAIVGGFGADRVPHNIKLREQDENMSRHR